MKKINAAAIFLTVVLTIAFTGCASLETPATGGLSETPLYYAVGTGGSALEAINTAKTEAVYNTIRDLLGPSGLAANRDKIPLVLGSVNINSLVLNETLKTISQGREGNSYYCEISVRINLAALAALLRSRDIYGNEITPDGTKIVMLPDKPVPARPEGSKTAPAQTGSPVGGNGEVSSRDEADSATAEERRIIDNYVRTMTYMVYFNEETVKDPFLMAAAVSMANQYLVSQKKEIIDSRQIEELKKDRELAYEESTGSAMSLIQWIAQKSNADVYGEIDAATSGETQGGRHYGQANVTIKFFESSTGRLLGSRNYSSPRTFSHSSQKDAVNNALQSSIYTLMPLLVQDVEGYMVKALAQGIKYELIIQNTFDARVMREFLRILEGRVKNIKRTAQAPEETRYEVYLIGSIEDLEDLIYRVSDMVPGLEGMDLVYMRGNSLTFHTGL